MESPTIPLIYPYPPFHSAGRVSGVSASAFSCFSLGPLICWSSVRPSAQGCQSLEQMYGLPGERYHVVVQGQDPYVEWTQLQSSMMTWDKHDFSFYFQKKVASRFPLDVGENGI